MTESPKTNGPSLQQQFIQNLVFFSGIIFAQRLTDPLAVLKAFLGYGYLCLVSWFVVRTIAILQNEERSLAGISERIRALPIDLTLPLTVAVVAGVIYRPAFGVLALAYFFAALFLDLYLKNIVVLDAIGVAAIFVIKAVLGALVLPVSISPWLLICTFLLALLVALGKRRNELMLLPVDQHREVLREYSKGLLDQMLSVAASATLIAYSLYSFHPRTVASLGTRNLVYTVPFVLYGVFRFLYLVYRRDFGETVELGLARDSALIVNVVLWCAAVGLILYAA